jgi:hypothetical protein
LPRAKRTHLHPQVQMLPDAIPGEAK